VSLDEWQPAAEVVADVVTEAAAAALHGLLDAPGPAPANGEPVPPLWHWLAFLPRTAQRDLGPDGHPRVGGFMPPVKLPRRMFAGARLQFVAALPVGATLERRSTVISVEEKTGRSGDLVFVKVRHELSSDGCLGLVEEQDIVYREPEPPAGGGVAGSGNSRRPGDQEPRRAAEPAPEADPAWTWSHELAIDTTVLFRFSALTYNAHRIHYDRPFATGVEGYPGLVVHGPLQAVALAELCRRHRPDDVMTGFRFRAMRPAFDDGPLQVHGRSEDDVVSLTAADHLGTTTMEAEASYR
jgi:3-methylfumaryl-CoA hydratase